MDYTDHEPIDLKYLDHAVGIGDQSEVWSIHLLFTEERCEHNIQQLLYWLAETKPIAAVRGVCSQEIPWHCVTGAIYIKN